MVFWLFLLLNAVLLLRPEDLFAEVAGLRLYLILISICLVAAAPRVAAILNPRTIADQPIVACVLGLLVAVVLSQLVRVHFSKAAEEGAEFAKLVAYFLLVVAVLDSPRRIRSFFGWIVGLVAVVAGLGILQYHGAIDWAPLRPVEQAVYDDSGELVDLFPRLRSAGIFNDPNDLCLILTTGGLAALGLATTGPAAGRFLWLLPLVPFGYALMLTHSRGGFLGLAAGLAVLAVARLGARRGLPLALVALAGLVAAFAGRQTDISLDQGDTAQDRLRLWAEGIGLLWPNVVTGIGVGEYAERVGLGAHNSFVHAYVETGLIGGTLYTGAFFLALVGLTRLPRTAEFQAHEARFMALRPFVLAIVAAYAVGTFSLSRNYTVVTYMVLGLAAAYLRVALPTPPDEYRLTQSQLVRLIVVGVAGLVVLKLVTQSLVRYGS